MSERRFGLRLRLLATLTGAGLLCGALLGLLLLLRLRDEIARRHVASVRQELRAVAASIAATCAGEAACQRQASHAAGVDWKPGSRCGPPAREGEHASVCEEVDGAAIAEEVDLAPAAAQARALVAPVLASVAAGIALLVGLVFWLLDRQLVKPLLRIDGALDHISSTTGDAPLLGEEGDLIGRIAPAVNRLEVRLREERSRVQAQIAQLQRSNAELRAAREEITRAERLASVGRLAAGVAHEVGNPMTALIGYLGILQERMQAGRDPGDYLERMAREAARIDRILRDLLTLARPPPAKLQPVDLRAAAESARALVEAQPTWTGCALEVRVPADLPPARGDAHYVVQVLLNLLINAAKAGASRVEVAGRAEGDAPILEVLDDGRGLPPEAATHLFEPFFTSSGPGEGSGLGLALCHATMERFGGSIAAGAGNGGGTVFTLRFAAWIR
jgi:C4-dicarboxylate-specific signal transduction histidine kinase